MAHAGIGPQAPILKTSTLEWVTTYEALDPAATAMFDSETDLEILAIKAMGILNTQFSKDERRIFEYRVNKEAINIDICSVMKTMLKNAWICGGDAGTRYVATYIIACVQDDKYEPIKALSDVGILWLTHLLFIFRPGQNRVHYRTVGSVSDTLRDILLMRDGFECFLTGFQDVSHPKQDPHNYTVTLKATQIIRQPINYIEADVKKSPSVSVRSAITTLNILRRFTSISDAMIGDLHRDMDDASNAILLEANAYTAYDNYGWALREIEMDTYKIIIYDTTDILRKPLDDKENSVIFRDRSVRSFTIETPNPIYISVHAAMAEIFHDTGAAAFFDKLLNKFRDDGAREFETWPQFDCLLEQTILEKAVDEFDTLFEYFNINA